MMDSPYGMKRTVPGYLNSGMIGPPGVNNYAMNQTYPNGPLSRQAPMTYSGVYQSVPSLPPRPKNTNNSPITNMYSSGYSNGYGLGGYGSYGGYGGMGYSGYNRYGGYSGYGSGYGSYGFTPENRFVQLAEESSRPAFQSIQSLVQTFGSVTMMLESTCNAFHSSFLAVLGVADNFGRLRSLFGNFFSAFALFRFINWCIKKLLYLIGLKKNDPVSESVWNVTNENSISGGPLDIKQAGTNWTLLTFLGVVITAPYMIYKLISTLQPIDEDTWDPEKNPGPFAVGFYDFRAESDQELSIVNRQKIMIAPKKYQLSDNSGWLLACDNSRKLGLVPVNYIGIIVPSDQNRQGYIDHNGQSLPLSMLSPDNILSTNFAQDLNKSKVTVDPKKPEQDANTSQLDTPAPVEKSQPATAAVESTS